MNRLTRKKDNSYVYIHDEFHNIGEHVDKLGQLEDIEEELGIDLITLFKAVKSGAWTKYDNEISKCDECEYEMLDVFIYFYWNDGKHLVFYLSEYGKSWALTKEELDNGKSRSIKEN